MTALGDTQTPMQALWNFTEGFVGVKPIFSGGVQIGNWAPGGGFFDLNAQDVMSSLCTADVSLNDNLTASQQDPSTWTTYDDWDVPIKAQDYCLQKGVIPNWLTADQLAAYQQNADGSITPKSGSGLLVPLAIAGGLVVLSLVLVARR